MTNDKIAITVDSSTDIPMEIRQKYGIVQTIPLYVNMNGTSVKDDEKFNNTMLLEYVESSGQLPATSAVTPDDFIECFSQYPEHKILHIGIGSSYSCCYQNFLIAAEGCKNAYSFDTNTLSCGGGVLAVYASSLIAKGMAIDEVVRLCKEKSTKLDISFVVNTLKYLHKGGRCSAVATFGANLLNIKPCIKACTDGTLKIIKKYRGNTDKLYTQYIKDVLVEPSTIDDSVVFVVHTAPKGSSLPFKMAEFVKQIFPFKECIITEAGSTIFTHSGPDAIGIMFSRK